jgi:predicted amidohydrolase YtcJ
MRKTLLALAALLASSSALADTLVTNANGIQVDASGKLERFTGLLIGNDGMVKRVLHGEMLKLRDTQVVDAGGRTILPGLIDAHGHIVESPGGSVGLGLLALQLDLSGATSLADVQQRLKSYADANPRAPWLVGRGWNQELWTDKGFPTAADLDKIVSDRPVWLVRVDGHAAVGNSAALAAGSVTSATRDPVGGRIERRANGEPTGLFIDNAIAIIDEKIPDPSPVLLDQALAAAEDSLLSFGITATADMGSSVPTWEAYRRAGEAGRLKVRIASYADDVERMRTLVPNGPTPWLYADRLRLGGVKIYADGALGSRGAWLKQPYADKPETSGLQFLTDEQLRQKADEVARRGLQVAIHAIGDAAGEQVIETFEWLNQRYAGDRRWRIIHAQILDPADIPRLAPAGIMASVNPVHQTSDRLMAEKRLGLGRLNGAYAWRSILQSGARMDFGSDYPVESPNPFPGMAAAVSRQDLNGQPPGGWLPQERISFEQALNAFTREAAHALFAEKKIGSLEPGKWADFIVVDRDVSKVTPAELGRTQVLETWVAGSKVWERAPSAGAERGR